MFRRRTRERRTDTWTLFFAADFHGADVCFRKFLNAAGFYGADVLVVGGDLTGKVMMPVVETAEGWVIHTRGQDATYRTEEAVATAEKELLDRGAYPFRTEPRALARLREHPEAQDKVREQVVREQVERWHRWAAERLGGVDLLLIPGNDDPWVVDDYLRDWNGWNIDGRSVEVRGLTFVGVGVSNATPWNSPRECTEEEIAGLIEKALGNADGPLVFDVHVPPHGTRLDMCPRVDEELRPVVRAGEYEIIHAGSTAVRDAIERLQPVLSLHGHIHESAGEERLGRTLAVNPGSEYGAGTLRGVLVTMAADEVQNYQFVTG